MHVPTSNTVTLDCGLLRIELQYVNDRWEHSVGWNDAGGFQPFVRSVEGKPDDLWPASPALQELHVEERADGRVAFLTGMAGSSHWSASIACDPAQHRATFDVACRCKQPPAWLGSLYQIPEGVLVESKDSLAKLTIPNSGQRFVIGSTNRIGSVPEFPLEPESQWTSRFLREVHCLQRTLFVAPVAVTAGTIRWEYSIAIDGHRHGYGR